MPAVQQTCNQYNHYRAFPPTLGSHQIYTIFLFHQCGRVNINLVGGLRYTCKEDMDTVYSFSYSAREGLLGYSIFVLSILRYYSYLSILMASMIFSRCILSCITKILSFSPFIYGVNFYFLCRQASTYQNCYSQVIHYIKTLPNYPQTFSIFSYVFLK